MTPAAVPPKPSRDPDGLAAGRLNPSPSDSGHWQFQQQADLHRSRRLTPKASWGPVSPRPPDPSARARCSPGRQADDDRANRLHKAHLDERHRPLGLQLARATHRSKCGPAGSRSRSLAPPDGPQGHVLRSPRTPCRRWPVQGTCGPAAGRPGFSGSTPAPSLAVSSLGLAPVSRNAGLLLAQHLDRAALPPSSCRGHMTALDVALIGMDPNSLAAPSRASSFPSIFGRRPGPARRGGVDRCAPGSG